MLPALPTGMQWTSGASPSASTISNAAVFWPSMRTGLMLFTTSMPGRSPSSRTISSPASNVPRTGPTRAPCRLRDARRVEERRASLEQRDHARGVGDGQVLAVRLDHAGPGSGAAHELLLLAHDPQHRAHAAHGLDVAQRVDGGAQVGLARPVRDEDESGLVTEAALLHRADRHGVAAELGRDRGEHTRAVGNLHRQVELRLDLVDR